MKKILNIIILICSIYIFFTWTVFKDLNLLTISIVLLNIFNMLFAIRNLEKRIYFLFFNITIFLFLLSKPFIDMLYRYEWNNYNDKNGTFALLCIGISLIGLYIGMVISEKSKYDNTKNLIQLEEMSNSVFIKHMQLVAWVMYVICLVFNLLEGAEKVIFIQSNSYRDYYITYQSQLPVFVKAISTMMPATLVIYLATMPNKKKAIIPIGLYLISAIPNLIVGSRGAISEALIFVFLYFFLRDNLNKKLSDVDGQEREIWITRLLKKYIFISVPIILISFSVYNYSRFGIEKENDMNPIVDFVYSQGVSFTIISRGYDALPYLPDIENKNYTFGPFIDYITRGTPAQILFGAEGLGAPNSIIRATEANNFNAALSYYLYGNMYLQGYGTGSSYIIELYADFGVIGIIIFSIALGMIFSKIGNQLGGRIIKNIFLLRILMDVFIIPRGSALSWLTFLIAPQFWLPIICCYIGATVLTKKVSYKIKLHMIN